MNNETINKVNSYLSFNLGDEEFAAHVGKVINILELTKITQVPKSPEYMKGVINLRGAVLPVIDTRIKFGMTPTEYTTNTCIVVLEVLVDGEEIKVGALVDSVQAVLELDENQIQPPPGIGSKFRSEFIYGIAKVDEKFIMLIDMDKVFSVDEVIMVKEKVVESENKEEITENKEENKNEEIKEEEK